MNTNTIALTLDALKKAEAALSDIGDADREPGDDVAWCEARAAEAIPQTRAAIAALEAEPPKQEAERDWSTAQDWKGMDGAIAWHLIDRHADGWDDVGAMMNAWLAAQAEPQGWRPISEAPKDGATVLVFPASWSNYTASMARWNTDAHTKKPRPYWERNDCFGKSTLSREKPPTHWMPLPTPPKD